MAEFTGAAYEDAVAAAEKHFQTNKDGLAIKVVEQGGGGVFKKKPWRIEASKKTVQQAPAATPSPSPSPDSAPLSADTTGSANRDASIKLNYTPDGVVLEISQRLSTFEVESYVVRRGVKNMDVNRLKQALDSGITKIDLAPPQEEGPPAPDIIDVTIAKDHMSAKVTLYPGDPDGERITFDAAMRELTESYRLVFGIDRQALRDMIDTRIVRRAVDIAKGVMPVEGENASINFHFQKEHTKRPVLKDGDKVDFKTLDLFQSVRRGDLLVSRTPPTLGEDGSTVYGKVLKARPGRDMSLPRGKGIEISEDKLRMLAAIDGVVSFRDEQVTVLSRYYIEGSVDMSTGNIDFVGDVEVRGNVISGMVIKAEGSVEIHGVVEAATIISGGDVVLHQGMQGMGKGAVLAQGDVVARYFERVRVNAHGVVTADAIYHSEINAVEGVNLAGKRASLIGGITRSAKVVSARSISSNSHTATIIEVGIMPEQRERYNALEASLLQMKSELDKLNVLVKTYGETSKPDEPPDRDAVRQRVLGAYRKLNFNIQKAHMERDRIKEEMESVTGGRVHVHGTIYPGGRIIIGSSSYTIDEPINYATFRLLDGEVRFTSYEL